MRKATYTFVKSKDIVKYISDNLSVDSKAYYILNEGEDSEKTFESAEEAINEVIGVGNESTTTITESSSVETIAETTEETPKEFSGDDIHNIGDFDYIRLTAPAKVVSNSKGKINVGGDDNGYFTNCGLRFLIEDSDGKQYYAEALSISPGKFEETFAEHAPADFGYEPSTVGDLKYSGCRITIVGHIKSVEYTEEEHHLLGFSFTSDSVIEDIEFFY